jgi:phosphoglycolate phosphatase
MSGSSETKIERRMKLIILDFDGTLADTRGLIVKTMQQTLDALGLEPRTDDQCAAMIGLPLKQAFTDLLPMTDEMGEQCVETYRRIFNANNALYIIPTFPNVLETLHQLHEQGYILTIASSRSNRSLMEFVNDMHLNEVIPYVLGAEDVARAKPHPDPVLQTLETFGCKPEDALVVGDTWYDIEMGRRAGVRTCGVTYGNGSREELMRAGADYLIDDFGELMEII